MRRSPCGAGSDIVDPNSIGTEIIGEIGRKMIERSLR